MEIGGGSEVYTDSPPSPSRSSSPDHVDGFTENEEEVGEAKGAARWDEWRSFNSSTVEPSLSCRCCVYSYSNASGRQLRRMSGAGMTKRHPRLRRP